MCQKFTPDELNIMDHETKNEVIYQMQNRLDKLETDYENLMEQICLANKQRFGRHTEKLEDIAGQLSFLMKRKQTVMKQLWNQPLKKLLKECCKNRADQRKKDNVKKT